MPIKCPICGKTFKTTKALGSHITYKHKRAKEFKDIATTTPPEIKSDPEIMELRRELEIKRLKRAIDSIDQTPKLIDFSEKLKELSSKIDKLESFYSKLRKILAWIDFLKRHDESHTALITSLILAEAEDKEKAILFLKQFYPDLERYLDLRPLKHQ